MNRQDRIKEVRILKEWAEPEAAGRARSAFLEVLANNTTNRPIITMPFGDAIGIVAGDGTAYDEFALDDVVPSKVEPKDETDEAAAAALILAAENKSLRNAIRAAKHRSGWLTDVFRGIPEGAAPTNKMIGDMRIACGLMLIIGKGGTAKTPLAHELAGHGGGEYGVVRFGEPLSGYTGDAKLAAADLAQNLLLHSDVVLDSVKDVLASMSGAATKSGLVRAVLPLLTQWATIAANCGATIYVPMNPSSNDQELIDLLVEASRSNSTMTVFHDSDNGWRYQTRGGEGLQRAEGAFTTSFDSDGLLVINSNSSRTSGITAGRIGSVTSATTFELDDSEFMRAMTRTIRSQQI